MENVVHKIYHLTFPNNETYVGSTSTPFNIRYGGYRNDFKKQKTPITKTSIQYKFKEVRMIEVDRIECSRYDSKVKMLEEEWKQKLKPTLNTYKAYQTIESKKKERREREVSTYGRLRDSISTAKQNIKLYTKQNKPDMVKKWEGILEVRIQSRLASQSS